MAVRGREGVFIGVGAGVTLVILLVLQSFIGSGLLSATTTTKTTTVSTIDVHYEQVASAYANHLLLLDARNVSGLMSGYASNATIEWTGMPGGLAGNYTGSNEIGPLLANFPGEMVNLTLSEVTQTPVLFEGGYWRVNSTFDWAGYSHIGGNVSGTIAAQDSYVHVGNSWLIASETWNFLRFFCIYPGCSV